MGRREARKGRGEDWEASWERRKAVLLRRVGEGSVRGGRVAEIEKTEWERGGGKGQQCSRRRIQRETYPGESAAGRSIHRALRIVPLQARKASMSMKARTWPCYGLRGRGCGREGARRWWGGGQVRGTAKGHG